MTRRSEGVVSIPTVPAGMRQAATLIREPGSAATASAGSLRRKIVNEYNFRQGSSNIISEFKGDCQYSLDGGPNATYVGFAYNSTTKSPGICIWVPEARVPVFVPTNMVHMLVQAAINSRVFP